MELAIFHYAAPACRLVVKSVRNALKMCLLALASHEVPVVTVRFMATAVETAQRPTPEANGQPTDH